ncbi:MAG TPA: SRPBCC domain-containing protein [Rhizomicrobium sp.]|jgi:uncharacterized protein YndB with AHSA1/START domain
MKRTLYILAGALLAAVLVLPQLCFAAVNDSAANGFSVTESVHIAAAPDKVYAALVTPANWWSSQHTFSKSAANLSLNPVAGGCWCEKLPDGGSAQHLIVYAVQAGKSLVMRGPLGPLQGLGVDGALTIDLKPAAGGTDLTATYNVGGYLKDGFAGFSAPVDRVLGEQFTRLKSFVETGSPEPKEH